MYVKRGQIYFAELPGSVGSEQRGMRRPCVILQNDLGNKHSATTLVAPLTSRNKKRLPTHVFVKTTENNLESDSIILLEQICTIDKRRLRGYVDYLDESKMREVERAVLVSFGITAAQQREEAQYAAY